MMARGIKLNRDIMMCNAQVIITGKNLNLQNVHWHEKCPPPTGALAAKPEEDGGGVSGLGGSLGPPAGPAGDHTRADATAA